jgi:hypothetical protein
MIIVFANQIKKYDFNSIKNAVIIAFCSWGMYNSFNHKIDDEYLSGKFCVYFSIVFYLNPVCVIFNVFVNEDNGEVYSLDRSATFIEAGDNISAENVDLIKESRAQRIYVFHESYYNNYVDLVKLFIEAEEIEQKNSNSEQYEQETNMVYLDYMKELFPTQEPEDVSEDDKERLAYNIVIVIKGMIDHPGYLSDMILPIKFHASEVHQEMTDEEQNLQRLIGEFYDEMIKRVSDCQYDLEVMKVFKDIFEIQSDLEAYLENNGVSSPMIKLFLEDSFQYIRTSEGME